jgi:site-specific DNA recombinase
MEHCTSRCYSQKQEVTGDVLLQKTFVKNTLKHLVVKNNGEKDQYLVEENHTAIIPISMFEKVQTEIKRRSSDYTVKSGKTHYSCKPLTGLIHCKECGNTYGRVTRVDKDSNRIAYWRCNSNLKKGFTKCKNSPTILESDIMRTICEKLGVNKYDDQVAMRGLEKIILAADGQYEFEKKF